MSTEENKGEENKQEETSAQQPLEKQPEAKQGAETSKKNEDETAATENPSAKAIVEEHNKTEDKRTSDSEGAQPTAAAIVEESTAEAPTDEELEEEDKLDEEVSSEEEDEENSFEKEALQLPDYSSYSVEKLVEEAEKLHKDQPVQKLKDHYDAIRKYTLQHLNEERKAKLAEFVEGGGVEMDFEFIQPLRERFRSAYGDYRAKRKKHYADLEAELKENLRIKNELIEQLKEIVSKDESIGSTFNEFNAIQQKWRDTGAVPRAEAHDLWRTYHHHVDNFYEYIKINKDLRDLDFKKNQTAKEQLIEQAKGLLELESLREAFNRLQNLHKKWKLTGPVERELREPLWEQFSAATKALHEKRDAYFEEQRAKAVELIERKKELVAEIKNFPVEKITKHNQWQSAIKGVEAVRQAFVKIGRLNHPENDAVWEELRAALKNFNHHKNNFYKEQKKEFQENLDKKKALLNTAEELKDSDDWKEATNTFKRIQADWKRIGHVPRSESDKIWKKFKAACNHYFERLSAKNENADKAFEENATKKEALLEEVKAFTPDDDQKAAVKALKRFVQKWKSIGKVPRAKMGIDQAFNKALDEKFKAIDLSKKESQRVRFESRMESLSGKDEGDGGLKRERSALYNQKEEAEKELNQLENNMSFFSSSNKNNPLLKEAQKKIDQQKEHITSIGDKIKMLNVKIREMAKAAEAEATKDTEEEPKSEEG